MNYPLTRAALTGITFICTGHDLIQQAASDHLRSPAAIGHERSFERVVQVALNRTLALAGS